MGAARFLPRKPWRQWRQADELRPGPHPTDAEAAARRFLLLGILPLWVDWRLLPKERPLSAACLAGIAGVIGMGVVLPYAEELRRCLRARAGA